MKWKRIAVACVLAAVITLLIVGTSKKTTPLMLSNRRERTPQAAPNQVFPHIRVC